VAELHGFGWLGDLRAAGGDSARRAAREMVAHWIEHHPSVVEPAWNPAILGRRLANWLGQYDFFAASAEVTFRTRMLESCARQVRHLSRALPAGLSGADLMGGIKGLLYGGLCLPGMQRHAERALALLQRELLRQVLADGGHISRSPAQHLQVLRDFIDMRALIVAAGRDVPPDLQLAIERMAPILRLFLQGDGGLSLFNGASEGESVQIEMALQRAGGRGRPIMNAPQSGFQRLQAGRTMAVADAGTPPGSGYDDVAHAGTLSVEISVGRERMIVNCGAYARTPEWRSVQAATAAHSTLVLGETNSAEVLAKGGLGRRPETVSCRREEQDGNVWLDMSHDGYAKRFGMTHARRIFMSAAGDDLRGEDALEPVEGAKSLSGPLPVAIRFHLHPGVKASLVQNGEAVLLRLPGGTGWRLRASGAAITLDESIYLGHPGEIRRCRQVVLSASCPAGGTRVKWALQREAKRR
jgi:uncharacterized heparinase superfamily protein